MRKRAGKSLVLLVTAVEGHEQRVFEPRLQQGAVKRVGRGRPRVRPNGSRSPLAM